MPLTATLPRRRHLASLSPHGFHRVVYYEWGDPDNRAGRDLRARHRPQRPRLRRAGGGARADASRARRRHARARRERLARRSERLRVPDVPDGADRADRAQRRGDGRLGRHVDGRPARHHDGGACRNRRSRGWSSTTSDRRSRRRRWSASPATSAWIPTFATYAEIEAYIRTISAPFGDLTDEQWAHVTRTNVRERPDGRWGLAYDPAHRGAVSRRARAGQPVAVVGRDPLSDAAVARRAVGPAVGGDRGRDGNAAGRSRPSSSSPASAMRRCCCRRADRAGRRVPARLSDQPRMAARRPAPRRHGRALAASRGRRGRGARAAGGAVGAVARAAAAGRIVARAEGVAARAAVAGSRPRRDAKPRQWLALLLPLYVAEAIVRALTEGGRHRLLAVDRDRAGRHRVRRGARVVPRGAPRPGDAAR